MDTSSRKQVFKPTISLYKNVSTFLKETGHFSKKKILFKTFVKVELSYVFTINLLTIAENCM